MTLAKTIASDTLLTLGFREPKEHPHWDRITEDVQRRINEHMHMMEDLAGRKAVPSQEAILNYEVQSSWWTGWVAGELLQGFASAYFVWKAKRKYRRYQYWLAKAR